MSTLYTKRPAEADDPTHVAANLTDPQRGDLLRLWDIFDDGNDARPAMIKRCLATGLVWRILPRRYEFTEIGEAVIKIIRADNEREIRERMARERALLSALPLQATSKDGTDAA